MDLVLAESLEAVDAGGSAVSVGVLPGVHEQVVISRLLEVFEVAVRVRRGEYPDEPGCLRQFVLRPEFQIILGAIHI